MTSQYPVIIVVEKNNVSRRDFQSNMSFFSVVGGWVSCYWCKIGGIFGVIFVICVEFKPLFLVLKCAV